MPQLTAGFSLKRKSRTAKERDFGSLDIRQNQLVFILLLI